jgi:hypothetical protein
MAFNHYKKFSKESSNTNKKPYSELNPHSLEAPVMRIEGTVIITSIDPGIKNCGVYTCAYDTINKTHKSIYLDRLDFTNTDNHFIEAISKLDELELEYKLFSSSHYIIIESQMTVNYSLVRMGQHLISYFLTRTRDIGNRPLIIEIAPQSKTKTLECPKGLSKYQYKKWCVNKAIELLKKREDDNEDSNIFNLENSKKKDDMGDVICQYYAIISYIESDFNKLTLPIKRF